MNMRKPIIENIDDACFEINLLGSYEREIDAHDGVPTDPFIFYELPETGILACQRYRYEGSALTPMGWIKK